MNLLEAYQIEAALNDRLQGLAQEEVRMAPGSLELACVQDAIRWTGAALTRLQVELYGETEDDMEATVAANTRAMGGEWGTLAELLPREQGITETEFRALWGDR